MDSDCIGDLICEERDGGDSVSGCSGGEESMSGEYSCAGQFLISYPPIINELIRPFLRSI